jgi:SPP1 gp7 family putative phage head morphogenesis protein
MAASRFLTKKRNAWVDRFNPSVAIRGDQLNYSLPVQRRYVKDVEGAISEVIRETEKEVMRIFKSDASKKYFSQDASIASTARIDMNALERKLNKSLSSKIKAMAERMVKKSDDQSKSALHSSLETLSGGLSIKTNIGSADITQAFMASVNVNVDLIKTISSNYLEQVKGAVNRSIQNGGGLQTLIPEIEKFLDKEAAKTKNKAKNVALDQTRKAYNALNVARMKKLGLNNFEWIHSGGGQVPRKHHITPWPNGLNHGIFNVNNPPIVNPDTGETGLPGSEINCRCTMRPLIVFEAGEETEITEAA